MLFNSIQRSNNEIITTHIGNIGTYTDWKSVLHLDLILKIIWISAFIFSLKES